MKDGANPVAESLDWDLLPDFAERKKTLERANRALERARALLDRLRGFEEGTGVSGEATVESPERP